MPYGFERNDDETIEEYHEYIKEYEKYMEECKNNSKKKKFNFWKLFVNLGD